MYSLAHAAVAVAGIEVVDARPDDAFAGRGVGAVGPVPDAGDGEGAGDVAGGGDGGGVGGAADPEGGAVQGVEWSDPFGVGDGVGVVEGVLGGPLFGGGGEDGENEGEDGEDEGEEGKEEGEDASHCWGWVERRRNDAREIDRVPYYRRSF